MELLYSEQFRMSFRVCKDGIRLNDVRFMRVLFDPLPPNARFLPANV